MKKFILIITAFFLCFSLFAASSNKALDEWNKLSEDEKWLCLLTEPFLYAKGVSMISVNPEPENAGEKSRNILERDWKLHSKKDIIAIVERYKNGQWGDEPVFQDVKKLYNKYPGVSIDEIATIECLNFHQCAAFCFYADNHDKMGSHGLLALDIVRMLAVIRWGVAANWLTEAEAVEIAKPLMTKLLNAYDSWEDFAIHFGLGWYYYAYYWGYFINYYINDIDLIVKSYANSAISDNHVISHNIKFPAKNQNKNYKLTYKDAVYTPSEQAQRWYMINRNVSVSPYDEMYLSLEERGLFREIVTKEKTIPAINLYRVLGKTYYHENGHKMLQMLKEWNSLSEYGRWFCILSEPAMEEIKINNIMSLNPGFNIADAENYLKTNMNATSKEDLLEKIANPENHSFLTTYDKLKAVLNQNPKPTVEQIAIKNFSSGRTITKLYFVSEMQNILGKYGLIAYDYCSVLFLLRVGISAGWFTEEEALDAATPYIDKLLNAYDSWEDYATHFVLGRLFCKICAAADADDCKSCLSNVLGFVQKYDITIPKDQKDKILTFHNMKFPGKKCDRNNILSYGDAVYSPSENAETWMLIEKYMSGYYDKLFPAKHTIMQKFLKKNKKIPVAAYYLNLYQTEKAVDEMVSYLSEQNSNNNASSEKKSKAINQYKDLLNKNVKIWDEVNVMFSKADPKTFDVNLSCYYRFYITYAMAAYDAQDLVKMNYAVSFLNEENLRENKDAQPVYCIHYSYKAREYASSGDYENAIKAAEKALSYFDDMVLSSNPQIINFEEYGEILKKMIEEYNYYLKN